MYRSDPVSVPILHGPLHQPMKVSSEERRTNTCGLTALRLRDSVLRHSVQESQGASARDPRTTDAAQELRGRVRDGAMQATRDLIASGSGSSATHTHTASADARVLHKALAQQTPTQKVCFFAGRAKRRAVGTRKSKDRVLTNR